MTRYIFFTVLLLITPIIVNANSDGGCNSMMGWCSLGGWGMFVFPVLWIAIIVGIVSLIIKVISESREHSPKEKSNSALEILKERYVKGEITKKQFDTMRKVIEE